MDSPRPPRLIARLLLRGAGVVLIAAALAANELVLAWLLGDAAMAPVASASVRMSQALLGGLGIASLLGAEAVGRVPAVAAWFARPLTTRLLLAGLAVFVPLVIAELALRPLAAQDASFRTTIFMADDALGWRLRPGAEDDWLGVRVKINAKGLRGPEVDYAKPPGTFRVLYLGDSVTFGFQIPSHTQTFPYLAGERIAAREKCVIETVNSGVGGYSPWQEHAYLASEGFRYDPDLVVVCFVLNDVTERFDLQRFGGHSPGFQLEHTTAYPRLWRIWRASGTGWGARRLAARLRFGDDVRAGAVREELSRVEALVTQAGDSRIVEAWEATLADLGRIVDDCRARDVPTAFVLFPFAWQVDDPGRTDGPQRKVAGFAAARGVPTLDLLPIVAAAEKAERARGGGCFLDDNHLSPRGHVLVADALARFLADQGLLR